MWDEETEFSRKEERKEKKILRKKDRSKYKKTDLNKKKIEPIFDSTGSLQGVVIAIHSHEMDVRLPSGESFVCSLKGSLKKEKARDKNLVIVGDNVFLQPLQGNEAVITSIAPRKSILSRQDNLHRIHRHLIAANVEYVFIIQSCVIPSIKTPIIDRYLIAAEKGGITPILVFNKIDLVQSSPSEKRILQTCVDMYSRLGISVLLVSAQTGEGLDALKEKMKNTTSVFSGQSGTGKTSLINAVTGLSLLTAAPISATNKGAHKTSSARLLVLPFGGYCVDTPGIRSFGIWDLEPEDLKHYFSEFFAHAHECAFSDCSHMHEPDCAIKKLVETGELSVLRYESYINLYDSVKKVHQHR